MISGKNSLMHLTLCSGTIIFLLILLSAAQTSGSSGEETTQVRTIGGYGGSYLDVYHDGEFLFAATTRGLEIIDVTNPLKPKQMSTLEIGGYARSITVQDNFAYIACENDGVAIIDITNPQYPMEISRTDYSGMDSQDVFVRDDLAFIAEDASGMSIVDVSDPYDPQFLARYDPGDRTYNVVSDGVYAYMAAGDMGFYIVDISNPQNPEYVSHYGTSNVAVDVIVDGDYAYVLDSNYGIYIMDISDRNSPTREGRYDGGSSHSGIFLRDDYIYLGISQSLYIIDISDKGYPERVGRTSMEDICYNVVVHGNYAYGACRYNGVVFADIRQKTTPEVMNQYATVIVWDEMDVVGDRLYLLQRLIDTYTLAIYPVNDISNDARIGSCDFTQTGSGVEVVGDYAYVLNGSLVIIDISDEENPSIIGVSEYCQTYGVYSMVVDKDHLFIANGGAGLYILDVSNKADPVVVYTNDTPDYCEGVAVYGDHLYMGNRGYGVLIMDISDPANPVEVGQYKPHEDFQAKALEIRDSQAYVGTSDGLLILDLTDPVDPQPIGIADTLHSANRISLHNDLACYAQSGYGLSVVDISDPSSPTPVGSYDNRYQIASVEFLSGYDNRAIIGNYLFGLSTVEFAPMVFLDHVSREQALDSDYIQFTAHGTGINPIIHFQWSSSRDGIFHESANGAFEYDGLSIGKHVITLRVMDSIGVWSNSIDFNLEIQEIYGTIATITPDSALIGQSISFYGNSRSSSSVVRHVWTSDIDGELHNDTMSNFERSELSPLSRGSHTISYRALNSNGAWSSDVTSHLQIFDTDYRFIHGFSAAVQAIETSGDYLYLGNGARLDIHDISDPTNPSIVSSTLMRGEVGGILVQGNWAYVESAYYYLTIVDISDRTDPVIMGTYQSDQWIRPAAVQGSFAYLSESDTFIILDISDPWNPNRISMIQFEESTYDIQVSGDFAYLANYGDGIRIIDISDPIAPSVVHSIQQPGSATYLALRDNELYVSRNGGNFSIYDVSNPLDPILILENNTIYLSRIDLQDDLMFLTHSYYGLSIFDISDSTDPAFLGSYDPPGTTYYSAVSADVAYLVESYAGISIIDISDPSAPSHVNEIPGTRRPEWIATDGSHLYVGHEYDAIRVYDLEDPLYPSLISTFIHYKDITGFICSEGYLYVSNGYSGISIIDISDPHTPFNISVLDTSGRAGPMIISGDHLFLSDYDKGIVIVNVTDKENPYIQENYDSTGYQDRLALYGDHLYIKASNSVEILNVSDRSNVVLVRSLPKDYSPRIVEVFNGYLFVQFGNEMFLYGLTDPSDPEFITCWDVGSWTYAWTQDGNTLYHTRSINGIYSQDLSKLPEISEEQISTFVTTSYSNMVCVGNYLYNADGDNGVMIMEIAPVGWFESISPGEPTVSQQVSFQGNCTPTMPITIYQWESTIDGILYSGSEPLFDYSGLSAGDHIITFKVQEESGIWSRGISTPLTVLQEITASIESITPSPATPLDEIHFHGSGSGGAISKYIWTSSIDGELANQNTPEAYIAGLSMGTHIITFEILDEFGVLYNGGTATLVVHGKPVVSISSITPSPALDTELIQFTAQGQDDGTIVRYVWSSSIDLEFSNETGNTFSTADLSVGLHTIFLRAQDDLGTWSDTVQTTLIIHRKPSAMIVSIIPNPADPGDSIRFLGSGDDDGTITTYRWYSSLNGELYNGSDPEFSPSELAIGTHTISLRVMDDRGVWSLEVTTMLKVEEKEEDASLPLGSIGPIPILLLISFVLIVIIGIMVVVYQRESSSPGSRTPSGASPPLMSPDSHTSPLPPGSQSQSMSPGLQTSPLPPGSQSQSISPGLQTSPLPPGSQSRSMSPDSQITAPPSRQSETNRQAMPQQTPAPPHDQSEFSRQPAPHQITSPPSPVSSINEMGQTQFQASHTPMQPTPGAPEPTIPQTQIHEVSQPQPDGIWSCPSCGNSIGAKFIFCTNCGYKRG